MSSGIKGLKIPVQINTYGPNPNPPSGYGGNSQELLMANGDINLSQKSIRDRDKVKYMATGGSKVRSNSSMKRKAKPKGKKLDDLLLKEDNNSQTCSMFFLVWKFSYKR
jgi:hypothetical protein